MSNYNEERRSTLASELLMQLRDVRNHINKITEDLGDSSKTFLGKVYEDHSAKIQEKVNLFNQNVEAVKNINLEITSTVNEWYKFVKDERELSRFLFPIRFHIKRKTVMSKTRELKQEITSLGIKNRIIREDIQHLESTLEFEATQRLKKDVQYADYLSHLKTKSVLIEDLKYLLPTLTGMPVKDLHLDRLDEAIKALS
jgi:hypothetical protein